MPDILKRILADAALMGILTVGFAFIVKKWLQEAVEHHFKISLEKQKVVLDIEKTKEIGILQTQASIYPQLVELVYRLRNKFRQKLEMLRQPDVKFPGPTGFGEELYLLTEHLYKFRAFLDDETFEILHETKQSLQDANVLINTLTRPPNRDVSSSVLPGEPFQEVWQRIFDERRQKLMPELEDKYAAVDGFYPEVVRLAKKQLHSFLSNKR